ncbi:MAG: outer membrane beta-barrel protein [Candidatus Zixiibacteriota bacterium]
MSTGSEKNLPMNGVPYCPVAQHVITAPTRDDERRLTRSFSVDFMKRLPASIEERTMTARTWSRTLPILASLTTGIMAAPAQATAFGDLTLGIGGMWPQGSLTQYSDPGPNFLLRANYQIPQLRTVMLWGDVNATLFSSETQRAYIDVYGGRDIPVDQNTSQYAVSFHLGLQTGNPSRLGLFRPRAAIGIGIYVFATDVNWKGMNQDDPIAEETTDSQGRFGWRGLLGSDFFFSPKWGIAVDLLYDQVWRLNQTEGKESAHLTSRFQGFSIGVVIPFETMQD